MKELLFKHRRIIALKAAVGSALAMAHFYPDNMPVLLVNLIWLFLF